METLVEGMVLGWDPARQRDTSALVVGRVVRYEALTVETEEDYQRRMETGTGPLRQQAPSWTVAHRELHVVHAEALTQDYPRQLRRVEQLARTPALARYGEGPLVIVDATGVGLPLVESLEREAKLPRVKRHLWTGGAAPSGVGVPVMTGYMHLQLALQQQRLKLPEELPLRERITAELEGLQVITLEGGGMRVSGAATDDFASALAMLCTHMAYMRSERPSDYMTVNGY